MLPRLPMVSCFPTVGDACRTTQRDLSARDGEPSSLGSVDQARRGGFYFAGRDARVPWYAKAVAVTVAAYALSPIDLIPDFIPILGQVDDLLIVPAGIFLAVKLIRLRSWQSTERRHSKPKASPPAAQPQPSSSQFGSPLRRC